MAAISWSPEFPMGGSALQIAAAQNQDGRLEIFYIGTGNHLYHNWQLAPNGLLWAGETPFVGNSALQVVAARNTDGRLEIFYIGTGNHLYHNWQTVAGGPTWFGETPFAGDYADQIAVGQNTDGRLEIFYVGTNRGIYHNWQTVAGGPTWFGETRFPRGVSAEQIAVGLNPNGRLEIFYIGTGGNLNRNMQTQEGSSDSYVGETPFANDSAKQVTVGRNLDGTLEIFYVGTNNTLYHNRKTAANSTEWSGEVAFSGDSAKQVTVTMNPNDELEIFYIGINNDLYHNWQTGANSTIWNGETPFLGTGKDPAPDSGEQITVATNAVGNAQVGLLEMFYIGTNNAIYHKWQTLANDDRGSNFNYIFSSDCESLMNVSVTINVTEDIVSRFSSTGTTSGFSFQLNAYSPQGKTCAWQQYVLGLFGSEVTGVINNWPVSGDYLFLDKFSLVNLPSAKIPAGYQLTISLHNDTLGNVISVTFIVIDNEGKTLSNVTEVLTSNGATAAQLAPITAFELNFVGPIDYEGSILSSGAGNFVYSATNALTAALFLPTCTETMAFTAETANTLYGDVPSTPSTTFTQTFVVTDIESPMIRRQRRNTPRRSPNLSLTAP
jgi:hypothetical protein